MFIVKVYESQPAPRFKVAPKHFEVSTHWCWTCSVKIKAVSAALDESFVFRQLYDASIFRSEYLEKHSIFSKFLKISLETKGETCRRCENLRQNHNADYILSHVCRGKHSSSKCARGRLSCCCCFRCHCRIIDILLYSSMRLNWLSPKQHFITMV